MVGTYWGIRQRATNGNLATTRNNCHIFGRNMQQLEKSQPQRATINFGGNLCGKSNEIPLSYDAWPLMDTNLTLPWKFDTKNLRLFSFWPPGDPDLFESTQNEFDFSRHLVWVVTSYTYNHYFWLFKFLATRGAHRSKICSRSRIDSSSPHNCNCGSQYRVNVWWFLFAYFHCCNEGDVPRQTVNYSFEKLG